MQNIEYQWGGYFWEKKYPFHLLQAHIHKWTTVLPTLNFSKFTLQFSETKVTCSATDK